MALDETMIQELRTQLIAEKEQLESELGRFAKKRQEGEYDTQYPEDLGEHDEENATEAEQYVNSLGVEQSLETQLKDVIDALTRMDNGTYGIDEETGEEIVADRLRAYPAARTNVRE